MTEQKYIIKKQDIEKIDEQQKVHFLNPNAQCTHRSLGDLTGLTGFGFHIMEVQPGHDTTEFHFHYNEDECVYVLSGEGLARIGDDVFTIAEGDFLGYRKGGSAHTIKNTGSVVLRCIVVGQRLDSDVVDYPEKEKRIFRTQGLKWKVANFSDLEERPIIKKNPTR